MPMHQGRGGSEAQRRRSPRRADRLLSRGLGGVTAIVIVVLVIISLTHSGHHSGHGCIALSLASATGGTQIYECRAAARAMCATGDHRGLGGVAAQDLRRACRQAGLPFD